MKQIYIKNAIAMFIVFVMVNIIYIIFGFFSPDRLLVNATVFIGFGSPLWPMLFLKYINRTLKKNRGRALKILLTEISIKKRPAAMIIAMFIGFFIVFFLTNPSIEKFMEEFKFPFYSSFLLAFIMPLVSEFKLKELNMFPEDEND